MIPKRPWLRVVALLVVTVAAFACWRVAQSRRTLEHSTSVGAEIADRLRLGDPLALTAAAAWYERTANPPAAEVAAIANAVRDRADVTVDEATVKGLMLLMRSQSVEFRRSASWTLSHVADRPMAGPLVRMLDEPDPETQWHIANALYLAANGPANVRVSRDMIPNYKMCARGCSRHFVALWKQWWRDGAQVEYRKGVNPYNTMLGFPGAPNTRPLEKQASPNTR